MKESNIIFTNQARVTETSNELTEKEIGQFLAEHPYTKNKQVRVTFFHTGVSSLVCKVETNTRSFIFKIALRTKSIDESVFLEAWSEAGVSVPKTYETGVFSGKTYSFQEYVDSTVLAETYTPKELVGKNVYFEMGRTLKLMHCPDAQGFGRPKDKVGQYQTFFEWLTKGEDIQEALEYVSEGNLYPSHTNIINHSIETLLQNISSNSKSSFCHDDYTVENIFATQPLTIFDPNPKYNHGLIDLGRSLASIISYGYNRDLEEKAIQQMIDGYSNNKTYVGGTILAAIILGIVWKSPYPHRTGNVETINIFNQYLSGHVGDFST